MIILSKQIYGFNAISFKTQMAFFIELEQIIFKFLETQQIPSNPNNLEKEEQS